MKICIPTETNAGKAAEVYGHFGSAPYFTIYDTQNEQLQTVNNHDNHHEHGQCNPLGVLAAYQIDAMITRGIGARAWERLQASGMATYLATAERTVQDVIESFQQQRLHPVHLEHVCQEHHCA